MVLSDDSDCPPPAVDSSARANLLPSSHKTHKAFAARSCQNRTVLTTQRESWADCPTELDDRHSEEHLLQATAAAPGGRCVPVQPEHIVWGDTSSQLSGGSPASITSGTPSSERANPVRQTRASLGAHRTVLAPCSPPEGHHLLLSSGSDVSSGSEGSSKVSSSLPSVKGSLALAALARRQPPARMMVVHRRAAEGASDGDDAVNHKKAAQATVSSTPCAKAAITAGKLAAAGSTGPAMVPEPPEPPEPPCPNHQDYALFSDAELQRWLPHIPYDEGGELTSVGSIRHDVSCKPCLFVHSTIGCQNGAKCLFCHFVHKRKHASRPCKGKRDRYKKLITRMERDSLERDSALGKCESI